MWKEAQRRPALRFGVGVWVGDGVSVGVRWARGPKVRWESQRRKGWGEGWLGRLVAGRRGQRGGRGGERWLERPQRGGRGRVCPSPASFSRGELLEPCVGHLPWVGLPHPPTSSLGEFRGFLVTSASQCLAG